MEELCVVFIVELCCVLCCFSGLFEALTATYVGEKYVIPWACTVGKKSGQLVKLDCHEDVKPRVKALFHACTCVCVGQTIDVWHAWLANVCLCGLCSSCLWAIGCCI